jgi:2-polyprenyl-6-hydroxyphenyl methylase/3-demethylubiquinone-9 3-methyltransferase
MLAQGSALMSEADAMRFEFGKNWHRFVRHNLTQQRCDTAKAHILDFIGRDSLAGLDFLDVGCGSGLHSLAAYQAGAGRVHSFDYDPNSVAATNLARASAGNPHNWTAERGDALDEAYLDKLGKWNLVYSWGVLHHTGDVWQAVRNAQRLVADGGLFYLALYSADVETAERQKFWLEAKQDYNRSGRWGRLYWEWWYIWTQYMNRRIWEFPSFLRRVAVHRLVRGMNLFADLRDWLGGWPMEYTRDQDVVDLLEQECGFHLINVSTGEACSEFLFERSGKPAQRTIVADMLIFKKAAGQSALPDNVPLETVVLAPPFLHESGHLYKTFVPQYASTGDSAANPQRSPLRLREDGTVIGLAHSAHAEIADHGRGRYSHWVDTLYFSSSDNSDPNTNGREYSVAYPAPTR